MTRKIRQIENSVQKKVKLQAAFKHLPTIAGVGKILSLTIMLKTGPIDRFAKVGDCGSYCSKVPTKWTSNGKGKGKGNQKNGNRYLAWALRFDWKTVPPHKKHQRLLLPMA